MSKITSLRSLLLLAIVVVLIVFIGMVIFKYLTDNQVKFSESGDLLIVDHAHYEVAFHTEHGGLVYLKDKTSENKMTEGNRGENLWWAIFNDQTSLNSTSATQFSYEWKKGDNELVFEYDDIIHVRITINFQEEHRFVMQATVSNDSQNILTSFRFPNELIIPSDSIKDGLLPMLPGALLSDAFFKESNSFSDQYPGVMFSPYVSVRTDNGNIAIYSLNSSIIAPLELGFKNQVNTANRTGIVYDYKTWISPETNWVTPDIVVQVGGDYAESIANYREHSKMSDYRSLADKLGKAKAQYYASPFLKLDISAIQRETWLSLKEKWLDTLDQQGVIHLVAFQQDGHDENYPDFLPPDPKWGSIEEFRSFIHYAQSKGNLVIPYTNFTWWGVNSPTIRHIADDAGLQQIVVNKENGTVMQENYGPHSGYVVDPNHQIVRERIAKEHDKLLEMGFDGIFEDQWGIRNTPFVFNQAIPEHVDPSNAYIAGMLSYFQSLAHHNYVEDGFDFLADTSVGFMGSTYLWDKLGYRSSTSNYTTYYPMIGMLARDKVMLFHHDLASETMTMSKDMLRWNLAMGYNLSADLVFGTNNAWIDLVGVFQKHVLSHYVDELVTSYEQIDAKTTQTRIGAFDIMANWDLDNSLELDEQYSLSPGGVQTVSDDGQIRAGVFSRYNGVELDRGDHYLVEIREKDHVTLYQPVGTDTTITVQKGAEWKHAIAIAYSYDDTVIAELPVIEDGTMIVFDYISNILEQQVGYVRLERSDFPSVVSGVSFEKQAEQINYALNKQVKSTTDNAKDFSAEKANDDDPFTYWESTLNLFPQSITLDLGQAELIERLELSLPPIDAWEARDQDIEVLISEDGTNFTTLLPTKTYRFDPSSSNVVHIQLDETATRYVRLTIMGNTAWPAAQLSEFKVY